MVHPNAKSLGKYSCYCQFKIMLTLKEKTAVDLSEPPPEVQLLRLLCLPPREGWGGMGMKMDSSRHHHNPKSSFGLFPPWEPTRFFSIVWPWQALIRLQWFLGLQGSRVRGQQVNNPPTGTSLGSLLPDPYEPYLHFLKDKRSVVGNCFFSSVLRRRWRGGEKQVYLCPDQWQENWERVLYED